MTLRYAVFSQERTHCRIVAHIAHLIDPARAETEGSRCQQDIFYGGTGVQKLLRLSRSPDTMRKAAGAKKL